MLTEEKRPSRRVPNLRYDSQEQHESSASDSDNGAESDSDNEVGSDSDSEITVLDGPPKFTQGKLNNILKYFGLKIYLLKANLACIVY